MARPIPLVRVFCGGKRGSGGFTRRDARNSGVEVLKYPEGLYKLWCLTVGLDKQQ